MSDNTPKPRNYKRCRCKAVESAPQLVAELIDEFDGSECPFHIGPRTQDAIRVVLQSREFYAQRCEALQRAQLRFRDPERQTRRDAGRFCESILRGQPMTLPDYREGPAVE